MFVNIAIAVQLAAAQQLEIPAPPRGYGTSAAEVVVDAAGVLSAGAVDRLNRIAFDVHARTGGEMAIVTMPDLGGRDVAEVALRIGREWGVGAAAAPGSRLRNAGVVVLVVPKEIDALMAVAFGQAQSALTTERSATTSAGRRPVSSRRLASQPGSHRRPSR